MPAARNIVIRDRRRRGVLKADALQNAILSSAGFASIATDENGVIQLFNAGAQRMLGYASAEVVNRSTPADFCDPLKSADGAARSIRDGGELTFVRKDGSRLEVALSVTVLHGPRGESVGNLLILTDNGASRRVEERLRQAEAGFRLMVESVTDCAIVQLDARGQVLSWNAGAQRIDGYSAQEIVGRHFSLLYSSEDAESGAPQRDLDAAAATGRYETRGWRARKDGSTYRASVVLTPIRDDAGALCGFARLARDIARPGRHEAPRASPASPPHVVQPQVEAPQPRKASGAPRGKLLYVDDNPASLGAPERFMALGSDALLLRAADANAGIELARAERPDAILLNFDLPGSGALRLMKLLRAERATLNTPVLALGADASPGALARALEAGFFHYLVKPLKAEPFLQALNDALEFAARERAEQNDLPVRAATPSLKEPR